MEQESEKEKRGRGKRCECECSKESGREQKLQGQEVRADQKRARGHKCKECAQSRKGQRSTRDKEGTEQKSTTEKREAKCEGE